MRKRTPGLAVYGLPTRCARARPGFLPSGGLHVLVP